MSLYVVLCNHADLGLRKKAQELLDALLMRLKKEHALNMSFDLLKDNSELFTLLEYAVTLKNLPLMINLLKAGASPNAGRRQPLYLACSLNNVKAVQLLLAHSDIDLYKTVGFNPQNNQTKGTPLCIALMAKKLESVELIFEKIAQETHPLKLEVIDAIQVLLMHHQLSMATTLLQKIAEYKNLHPEEKISKMMIGRLNALFRFIIDKPVDISLYNAYMNATKNDINQSIPFCVEDKEMELKMLPWICLPPNENRAIAYEWIQFILNEGFNLNQMEQDASIFHVLATLVTPDVLKVILENGKVEQAHIETSLTMAKNMKDAEKAQLLQDHLTDKKNCMYIMQAQPLSFEMFHILTKDNVHGFTRIFRGNVKANVDMILFSCIENSARNILLYLFKNYDPFTIKYEKIYSAFTVVLMQGLFDVIDSLWNTYLLQERKDLDKKLQNCRYELQHFKEIYGELPPLYFEALFGKIQMLETWLIQTKEQQEKQSLSSYSTDTNGITFFKCMSQKKYMMEAHPTFSEKIDKEGAVKSSLKEHVTPIVYTWFDNKTINLAACISIENANSPCYLVLLPDVDSHPDKVFENQSRYHFDPFCIKSLSGLELNMAFSVEGKDYDFEVSHELKSRKTEDRILIARKSSNEGRAAIYVAFKYVEDGLHEHADTKNVCASIKNAKPLELDFLLENNKTNKPF